MIWVRLKIHTMNTVMEQFDGLGSESRTEFAKELGLKKGDMIKCSVSRYEKKKIQKSSLTLKVAAVLSPRAGFVKSI